MKLRLPLGVFRAYLFDCDGTIVDSMPLHYIAWKKALAECNCAFDEQLFYAWGGTPVAEIVALLNERQGLTMSVESEVLKCLVKTKEPSPGVQKNSEELG